MADLFMGDDAYHGGAFMLSANFDFYTFFHQQDHPQVPPKSEVAFDYGTNDGYGFYLNIGATGNLGKALQGKSLLWEDQVLHDTYDDYWKSRNLAPHLKNVHCAVLTVGGWFDAEDLQGPFSTFYAIDQQNSGIFNGLVEGPWVHGGWYRYNGNSLGSVSFASDTADYYRKNILFPFFEHYLKATGEAKLPKAYVFETGTNVWRQYQAWPPPNAIKKMLYFQPGGVLSLDPPSTQGIPEFDEYVSDPAKPVPFISYTALDVPQEYMVADQRFATTRTDVLVYQTPPLEEDITIAGPLSPRLFISTTGTDSDFDVKLIDVYPPDYPEPNEAKAKGEQKREQTDVPPPQITLGGYQQLVRGEPFRGKFRHSFEKPEPFTPGKVEEINFTMPGINHTFRRGHRIMVHVQSSWFPLTDRNPQSFVDIPHAKPSDFVKATERVYHSPERASGIAVNVMPEPAEREAK
jgi:putative CocE/NonD family hydrolase